MAGYIAGMTLGDGTFRFDDAWRSDKLGFPQMYWRVAVADREILERLQAFLAKLGIAVHIRPFLQGAGGRKTLWKVETRAKASLKVIADTCRERDSADWRAGWLGGMLDAEGSHDRNLRISQKDIAVLERAAQFAASFGITTKVERFARRHASTLRVEGGAQEKAHFLSVSRPVLQRKIDDIFGRRLDATVDEVTAIERFGEREVVDIQTSTGTFIAAGICTHNCYALTFAERFRGVPGHPYENGFDLQLRPERLAQPLQWKRPKLIFVNSMSDLFHEDIPEDYISKVFEVMKEASWHTFQVLTKRSKRLAELAPRLEWPDNVWMGVSVENQRWTRRIDDLRTVPAAVRFLSCEPLLGPLDLDLRGIHWVIVGGESGPRARRMRPEWATSIRDQCLAADVPFFFKQWGAFDARGTRCRKHASGRHLEGRTWDEIPIPASRGVS